MTERLYNFTMYVWCANDPLIMGNSGQPVHPVRVYRSPKLTIAELKKEWLHDSNDGIPKDYLRVEKEASLVLTDDEVCDLLKNGGPEKDVGIHYIPRELMATGEPVELTEECCSFCHCKLKEGKYPCSVCGVISKIPDLMPSPQKETNQEIQAIPRSVDVVSRPAEEECMAIANSV